MNQIKLMTRILILLEDKVISISYKQEILGNKVSGAVEFRVEDQLGSEPTGASRRVE